MLEVAQRPTPNPGPDQVLVAVSYAAVTFVETQIRAGIMPPPGGGEPPFPLVLGNGVTGTVVETGAEVDRTWLGQPVVTATGGSGGYAQYAAVPVRLLHTIPKGLDARNAVALLADGRTAMALVRAARLRPADCVIVTAAAGGVGSLLVQLARAAGVEAVIGLAGGDKKQELARALGADVAIDYRQPGWEQDVWQATGGAGIDVAFDGVGGSTGKAIVGLLKKGGRYLPHGMASGEFYDPPPDRAAQLEVIPFRSLTDGAQNEWDLVEHALAAAAQGTIKPVIGQVFPLEQAAEAHRAIEARETVGKTLLSVTP